ncbi:hypothetical protein WG66_006549 [Moniliophthora roreri]|nr:hypothetical protein WG66_006549 [Moniliophthora roreri]
MIQWRELRIEGGTDLVVCGGIRCRGAPGAANILWPVIQSKHAKFQMLLSPDLTPKASSQLGQPTLRMHHGTLAQTSR